MHASEFLVCVWWRLLFLLQKCKTKADIFSIYGIFCACSVRVSTNNKKMHAITLLYIYIYTRKQVWKPNLYSIKKNCRVSLTLNMYFVSFKYTSPTFIASMVNCIASLTFIIAVALRFEVLDLKNPHGISKVLGTLISLAGVMTMTLYKGPVMSNFWRPLFTIQPTIASSVNEKSQFKGSLLIVLCCVTWSLCFIMQVRILTHD